MRNKNKNEEQYVTVGDATLDINGELKSENSIAVSGHIVGNITVAQDSVLINRDCDVTGDIEALCVIVDGVVNGGIRAAKTIIREKGVVNGPIHTAAIIINDGGIYNGTCNTDANRPSESDTKQTSKSSNK